jgi:signal transduction histidine kinase
MRTRVAGARKDGTKTLSLRARLTVLLALAVLVAMGAAAWIVDWRADSEMQQRFDASLLARAQALAALVRVEDGKIVLDADEVAPGLLPGQSGASWYALECGGALVAQTAVAPPPIAADADPTFADARLRNRTLLRVVAFRFDPTFGNGRVAAGAPTCMLRYGRDRGPLDDILAALDFILLGSLLGACVVVMLATPWLVRRGLRPIAVLDNAMAGIGPDTPAARLPQSATTELVPLVARFNEVLGRMDAGLARERQFASGLAHEFRTRLAELRALVDVETRYPSGRGTRELLAEAGSIGAELEAIVTALLQLTRIQSGLEETRPESVALQPLLARVCDRHRNAAQARGISIDSGVADKPSFAIETDPTLLEIVLDNLLGNAVAYAPAGSGVSVRADGGGVVIGNTAPSLRPDDLAQLGQRFWRKSTAGAGHAGLGLALAGAAARALHMRLAFELREGVLQASVHWDEPTANSPDHEA